MRYLIMFLLTGCETSPYTVDNPRKTNWTPIQSPDPAYNCWQKYSGIEGQTTAVCTLRVPHGG